MPEPPTTAPVPPWIDAWGVGAAAVAGYVLLGVDGFSRDDSVTFYMLLAAGRTEHLLHPLYLPLVAAIVDALQPLGTSLFRSMVVASSLCTAVGIVIAHRAAAHLGASRRAALAFAAWLAVIPSVLHFATTIEVHGVFFAFAALAFWATARYVAAPSWRRATAIGLSAGLATCVHASGHLLPLAAAALALGAAVPVKRALIGHGIAGAVGHAAGYAGVMLTVVGADPFARPAPARMLGRHIDAAVHFDIEFVPLTPWQEWAWPFAPLSALALLALFVARSRRAAVALHLALVPYLVLSHVLLSGGYVENGAYVLPLALPAAWLGVTLCRSLRWPVFVALWIATLALAVGQRDRPLAADAGAAAPQQVFELAGDDGVVVLGDAGLADRLILARPGFAAFRLDALRITFLSQDIANFDAVFAQFAAAGRAVLFDVAAIEQMDAERDPFLTHLRTRYELAPVSRGEFRAVRLSAH